MRNQNDLTGQHFGMLAVTDKTEKQQDRYRLWLCRCDCGKEICVNTSGFRRVSSLKNGRCRVSTGFKRQRFHIGTFTDFGQAAHARLEAEHLIHDGVVSAYRHWIESGTEKPLVFEVEKIDGAFHVITDR